MITFLISQIICLSALFMVAALEKKYSFGFRYVMLSAFMGLMLFLALTSLFRLVTTDQEVLNLLMAGAGIVFTIIQLILLLTPLNRTINPPIGPEESKMIEEITD